jgi:hypothetical protein
MFRCSPIPTLLWVVEHQHVVACTTIQKTLMSCHYVTWK